MTFDQWIEQLNSDDDKEKEAEELIKLEEK